ncbi:MAG: hypothetical protein ACQET7_15615, partial [Thermodesulfobacteriota bacterium]
SFHPEMVFFANLGVNLRGCLCGVLQYASAQPLDLTRAIHGPRPSGALTGVPFRYPAEWSLILTKNPHF